MMSLAFYVAVSANDLGLGNTQPAPQFSEEQLRSVAKKIFNVSQAMTDEYSYADGVGLTMYILRYMAELANGRSLSYNDIKALVKGFESLRSETLSEDVHNIINQIQVLHFGIRRGKYSVRVISKNPAGIIIDINRKSEDPNSGLKEIKRAVISNGARLYFQEAVKARHRAEISRFIRKPIRILGVFNQFAEPLNQIHSGIKGMITSYLESEDIPAPPMMVDIEGMRVEISTRTILRDMKFHFKKAYCLPGIRDGEEPLPSLVMGAKSGMINLKVSIDE
jgi:hypothetical protein